MPEAEIHGQLSATAARCAHCVWFVALIYLTSLSAFAQLSPGALSKSHSSLEGTLQCVKCHTLGAGRAQLKCSSCHADIAERVVSSRGYHARIVDRTKGDSDCARCHAEHAGRDFELIRWPSSQASFDHAQTGYRLQGRHSALQCNLCHKTQSFLGLKTQCLSCHQDTHKGQLSGNCTSCHSENSWKPAPGFNHQATRFALTGLHTAVLCERCHASPQPGAAAKYNDIPFRECSSCHRDPHQAAFRAACADCHNTNSWRPGASVISANFDHSKTAYPLSGRHTSLQCRSCHKTTNYGAPVASARCTDCHTDKHGGQFAARADAGDCTGCHTTNGFKPATFDATAHARTRYPLFGKHFAVACEKCHAAMDKDINYYPQSNSCVSCHRDVHAGQFAENFKDNCEACHRVEGFLPSTFTLVRHREAKFTLAGAHSAIPCIDCHTRGDGESTPHRYRFADMTCTGCHSDPHDSSSRWKDCTLCHSERSWTPRAFDHGTTRFALAGVHRTVSCIGCHDTGKSAENRRLVFRDSPQTCSSCHADIHAAQFERREGGKDCASCHQPARWKPANFDHDASAFPLDGRHRGVACVSCHKQTAAVEGRQAVVYRQAPKECVQCH